MLLENLESSERKYDIEKLKRAYEYADSLHAGQFRLSGEPYISHPVAVASIVAGLGLACADVDLASVDVGIDDRVSALVVLKLKPRLMREIVAVGPARGVKEGIREDLVMRNTDRRVLVADVIDVGTAELA